jgi:Ser/Thr protein kinase RdoA (MazF antagonist)
VLRAALRLRIDQTSLRNVAREVGMSLGGFHGFLAGTDAHPATLRKVRAWYVREMARRREEESLEVDSATAQAALAVLLEDIPAHLRAEAEKAMRSALTDWCGQHRARAPGWASGDG